jgi:hypothetical protein
MLPTRFQFVWPSGFRGEDFFYKSTNQKHELPVAAIASMEGPLYRMQILSRSDNKDGHHRKFLFLIGRFLKIYSALKWSSQMNRNLVGSTNGRFCIKFPQSREEGERHRLRPPSH